MVGRTGFGLIEPHPVTAHGPVEALHKLRGLAVNTRGSCLGALMGERGRFPPGSRWRSGFELLGPGSRNGSRLPRNGSRLPRNAPPLTRNRSRDTG